MSLRGPLHRVLRERTTVSHREVEAHPWMRNLLMPALSREQYADVLYAFLAWYRGLESWLHPVAGAWPPDRVATRWSYQPRVPALEHDLSVLGGAPRSFPMPHVASEADPSAVLGVLYVVEGSTLGGRVIANRVRTALGPAVPVGHFLPGDGAAWPAFVELMDAHAAHFDPVLAVEAACRTFDGLKRHLDACESVARA